MDTDIPTPDFEYEPTCFELIVALYLVVPFVVVAALIYWLSILTGIVKGS